MVGKISPWEWETGRKNSGMVGTKRKERTGIIKQVMRTLICSFFYSQTFLTFYVYSNGLCIGFVVIHPRVPHVRIPTGVVSFDDKVRPLERGV